MGVVIRVGVRIEMHYTVISNEYHNSTC